MIKKILLICAIVISVTQFTTAQLCTPDSQYTQYGVYPDTGLASGTVGSAYQETVTLVILSDTMGVTVDSVQMISVDSLPPGLSYVCNPSDCSWLGGSTGCILISGTPTDTGTYNPKANVNIYLKGFPAPLTEQLDASSIEIKQLSVGTKEFIYEAFVSEVAPNPFSDKTNIIFTSPVKNNIEFKVFNILGKEVYNETVDAHAGENKIIFTSGHLPSGIYMYLLNDGENTITKKMLIDN